MDFIKGNEQVRIDPSGIDISGVGNIIIDSNSVTGDISFNSKVNFTGDVSMNGKVSISENLDVTGDVSMNGIIDLNSDVSLNGILDMCGNIKFDDTNVSRADPHNTWFGPNLRGGMNIGGGEWTMMKNKPAGPDAFDAYTDDSNSINFTQDSGSESLEYAFGRPTSELSFTPDEILITSIASDGERVWWILDYTIATNVNSSHSDWTNGPATNTLISTTVIKASSSNVSHITHLYSWVGVQNIFKSTLYFNEGTLNPSPWNTYSHPQLNNSAASQFHVWRANETLSSTDYNHSFMYHQGMSIFFRNSANAIPIPYPTLIKKESDHLHITAPLNIYPEGNYELSGIKYDLSSYRSNTDAAAVGGVATSAYTPERNAGDGWYLVRHIPKGNSNETNDQLFLTEQLGTFIDIPQNDIHDETITYTDSFSRSVGNYDYDEIMIADINMTPATTQPSLTGNHGGLFQIWSREFIENTLLETNSDKVYFNVILSNPRSDSGIRVWGTAEYGASVPQERPFFVSGSNSHSEGIEFWSDYGNHIYWKSNTYTGRKIFVRRSDGQPVRLKNKVKVDVDGNLDVDGIITCSQITASKSDNGINGLTVTNAGWVGIGTTGPQAPLEIFGASDSITKNTSVFVQTGNGNAGNGYIYASDSRTKSYTLICNGDMLSREYMSYSDSRIKTDTLVISDDVALKQVNALESKKYHYIDPERRRPTKTIGFIAQEVKDVIPNAINFITDYIPDEMRIITEPQWTKDAGKYYLNIPDLDMSGAFTNKAKFYVSNDPSGNDEVCKEVDIKEVPTISMNEFSTTKYVAEFDQSWNNIFFYGKEVTDFHTIDKAQIFALHHSAIQELDRKHEREVTEKNNKIQNLEGEVSNLTGQISSLTSRLEALEASVLSLQNN